MMPVMYNNNYQIVQTPDHIMILVEMAHDARIIPMNAQHAAAYPKWMGDSIGRWEGDTLIIETDHYNQGVLNQFVEVAGEPMRGLLHSNALRTVERITFDAAANRFNLVIEHYDPVFFTQDFPISEALYAPSDLEIKPFGCIPEQLK